MADPALPVDTAVGSVQEAEVADTTGVRTFVAEPMRINVWHKYSLADGLVNDSLDRILADSAAGVWANIIRDTRLPPSPKCGTGVGLIELEVSSLYDVANPEPGTTISIIIAGGIAAVRCVGEDGLVRIAEIGLRNERPPTEQDGRGGYGHWADKRYETFLHEIGHALGIGTLTSRDQWSPPFRWLDDGSTEVRYLCEYRSYSGETRTANMYGFRTAKYRPAIAEYMRVGGHFDDFLPGGTKGHLHWSLTRRAIMSAAGPGGGHRVNGVRQKPGPTTVTVALLESLGYDVDLSLAIPTTVINGVIGTSVKAAGEHEVCHQYAATDADYDPLGRVNVIDIGNGEERVYPTRLVRNW